MHLAVKRLEIDLIIRGQRDQEELRAPIEDDSKLDGIPIVLPIKDWTVQEVYYYLKQNNIELPRFYEAMNCSVDCMLCTAYLKDTRGKVGYLRKYHPVQAKEYERRLSLIGQELRTDIDEMKQTLEEING